MTTSTATARPSPWLPYLRLIRAPAVFSALGDPLAGMLVVGGQLRGGHLPGGRASAARAAGTAAAAAALYLAGMALNDVADRDEDARERPERPIPSGAVTLRTAASVGAGLMAVGVVAGRAAGSPRTSVALAALVTAYDFRLKHSPALGLAAMGGCRSLSFLMGAEAGGGTPGVRAARDSALLLGAYVAGLTLLARGETGGPRRAELVGGAVMAAAALGAAAGRGGWRALPWAAGVAALAGPAVIRAMREPGPATTGPAVGALIRAIPALDGALAAPRTPGRALLLLPLLALTRWGRAIIPIT